MRKIEKKTWPGYFDDIKSGKKKYDLRLNDFRAAEGDILVLKEYDPRKKEYSGRVIEKKITYVGKFKIDKMFWSKEDILKKGIQVISLKD